MSNRFVVTTEHTEVFEITYQYYSGVDEASNPIETMTFATENLARCWIAGNHVYVSEFVKITKLDI